MTTCEDCGMGDSVHLPDCWIGAPRRTVRVGELVPGDAFVLAGGGAAYLVDRHVGPAPASPAVDVAVPVEGRPDPLILVRTLPVTSWCGRAENYGSETR